MRVSTSFSEEDIEIMDLILTTLLRGGGHNDVRVVMKRPAFGSLLHRIKGLRLRSQQPAPVIEAENRVVETMPMP